MSERASLLEVLGAVHAGEQLYTLMAEETPPAPRNSGSDRAVVYAARWRVAPSARRGHQGRATAPGSLRGSARTIAGYVRGITRDARARAVDVTRVFRQSQRALPIEVDA